MHLVGWLPKDAIHSHYIQTFKFIFKFVSKSKISDTFIYVCLIAKLSISPSLSNIFYYNKLYELFIFNSSILSRRLFRFSNKKNLFYLLYYSIFSFIISLISIIRSLLYFIIQNITSGFSTSPRNKRSPRLFQFPQTSTKKISRGDKLAESIKPYRLSGVSRMTVIVSDASRIMPRVSPGYYETATEPNRRRQCGVEMRRRHQAIWRTVLPFTLFRCSDHPLPPFVVV